MFDSKRYHKISKQLWIVHITLWLEGYLELRLQFFRGLDYFNWRTEDPTDVATCQPPSGHLRFRPRWSPPSSCCPLDGRRRTGCPASPGRSQHAYPGHSSIPGYLVAVYPAEPYCQGEEERVSPLLRKWWQQERGTHKEDKRTKVKGNKRKGSGAV